MRRRTSLQPYTDQEKASCVPRGMQQVRPPLTPVAVRTRDPVVRSHVVRESWREMFRCAVCAEPDWVRITVDVHLSLCTQRP